MKTLDSSFSTRVVLIPVIMAVSLFLVFLGMRTPDLPHTQKPNGHHRAIVENQAKEDKAGVEKSVQDFEICHSADLVDPPAFHVSSLRITYHSNSHVNVFPIPPRAPPASHA